MPKLSRGSVGNAVKVIQYALQIAKHLPAEIPDGKFGELTEKAVMKWETEMRAPYPTGIVSEGTYAAMEALVRKTDAQFLTSFKIIATITSAPGGVATVPAPAPVVSPKNIAQNVTSPLPTAVDAARPRADINLTKNVTLFELTRTNNTKLQTINRTLTDAQVAKLTKVAQLIEVIREIWGSTGVDVHSGFRSDALNGVTAGSSPTSQHPKCEAADISPRGPDTEASIKAAFEKLLAAAKAGKFQFGQLIIESAARDYDKVWWIHISLGVGYRAADRCGEVMSMKQDATGKPVYTRFPSIQQIATVTA